MQYASVQIDILVTKKKNSKEIFHLVLKLHLAWYSSMRQNITAYVVNIITAGII